MMSRWKLAGVPLYSEIIHVTIARTEKLYTHKICELGVGCFYNANDDDNEDNDDGNVDNDNDDNDGADNDDNDNEGDNDLQLFCVVFAINGNR